MGRRGASLVLLSQQDHSESLICVSWHFGLVSDTHLSNLEGQERGWVAALAVDWRVAAALGVVHIPQTLEDAWELFKEHMGSYMREKKMSCSFLKSCPSGSIERMTGSPKYRVCVDWMAKKTGGKTKRRKIPGKNKLCSQGACKEPHKYSKSKWSVLNLCQDREHKVVSAN